jgi:hypothetical protein
MTEESCHGCGHRFTFDLNGVNVKRVSWPDAAHTGAHAIVPWCPQCGFHIKPITPLGVHLNSERVRVVPASQVPKKERLLL